MCSTRPALDVGITTTAGWQLTVEDAGGETVASWSGDGASAAVTWGGTSGGRAVSDGVYTAQSQSPRRAAAGHRLRPGRRRHDGASALRRIGAPWWFSPNGDGQGARAAVTYAPAETCNVRVGLLDQAATSSGGSTAGGHARARLHGDVGRRPHRIRRQPRGRAGRPLPLRRGAP